MITQEDREVGTELIGAYYGVRRWPGERIYERTLASGETLTAYIATEYADTIRLLIDRPNNLAEVFITIEALERTAPGLVIHRARHASQPAG